MRRDLRDIQLLGCGASGMHPCAPQKVQAVHKNIGLTGVRDALLLETRQLSPAVVFSLTAVPLLNAETRDQMENQALLCQLRLHASPALHGSKNGSSGTDHSTRVTG